MTVLGGSVEECFSEISRTADRSQFCAGELYQSVKG